MYSLYAIRDVKTGFLTLTQDVNDASACRNFEHAVLNHQDSLFFSHPEDYALYYLGDFDSDSGVISPVELPQLCLEASSVLSKAFSQKGGIDHGQS